MQAANECEREDILTAIGDFRQLALEVANAGFEAVAMSYLDGEKVVVVPLDLPTRDILSEKRFDYLLEVVERMWWQGVEQIRGYTSQTGWKG